VAATAGEREHARETLRVPTQGTVLGDVPLRSGEAVSLPDLSSRVRLGLEEIRGLASAALIVPLLFRGRPQGILLALDSLQYGDPAFDVDAEHLLTSFAAAAANALATAQSVEAERLRHSIEASEQKRRRWAREPTTRPCRTWAHSASSAVSRTCTRRGRARLRRKAGRHRRPARGRRRRGRRGRGEDWDVSGAALWWPPAKIAGRYLSPYLALRHGEIERPSGGVPVEVALDNAARPAAAAQLA